MKIGRVRFDGKLSENIITENLLQPNYLVYNLDLHCIFWSDVGLQRVCILSSSLSILRSFCSIRSPIIVWIQVTPKYLM